MSAELPESSIRDIKNACRNMFFTKETRNYGICVMGPPGVGKTDMFEQLAEEWGAEYRVFLTATMDPTDIVGVPHEKDNVTYFCAPSDWIALTDKSHLVGVNPETPMVAVLEDLPSCSPQVFNALLRPLCNGEVAGARIRDNVLLGATGNRVEDKAGAAQITSALANRFIHFSAKVDVDEWVEWAIANKVDPFIVSFIQMQKISRLHNFDPTSGFLAFPTPRSVTMASNMIKAIGNKDEKNLRLALSGCCGSGWAQDFLTFYRIRSEMVSVDDIYKAPNKAKVPKESQIDLLYVTVNNLIADILADYEKRKAKAFITYMKRIPSEEIALFGLRKFLNGTWNCKGITPEQQQEITSIAAEWKEVTDELFRIINR